MGSTFYWSSILSTNPTVGANWTKDDGTTGNVPATGDVAVLQALQTGTAADLTTTASQLSITLAALYIDQTYPGNVGTATLYWQIGASNIFVGRNTGVSQGTGSGRIKLNVGGVQCNFFVFDTGGASADNNRECVRFLGTNTANAVYVTGGQGGVGLATSTPGEVSTFATINVTGDSSVVNVGGSVTWQQLVNNGGTVLLNPSIATGSATTLTTMSGTTSLIGQGIVGTMVAVGGTINAGHRATTGNDIGELQLRGGELSGKTNSKALTVGTLDDGGGTLDEAFAGQMTFGAILLTSGTSNRRQSSLSNA